VLAKVAALVGEAGGNILEVLHNRMATDTSAKLAHLGMTVEARDAEHAEAIKAKLESAGFKLKG
jgi:threonine dehydratase